MHICACICIICIYMLIYAKLHSGMFCLLSAENWFGTELLCVHISRWTFCVWHIFCRTHFCQTHFAFVHILPTHFLPCTFLPMHNMPATHFSKIFLHTFLPATHSARTYCFRGIFHRHIFGHISVVHMPGGKLRNYFLLIFFENVFEFFLC